MVDGARDQIAHLYRRAGFGPGPAEMEDGLRKGVSRTLADLLDGDPAADTSSFDFPPGGRFDLPDQMAGDWIVHFINTSQPLVEKMVLFWHNHFATANSKVNHAKKMYHQNVLFRQYALGNFRDLLHGVATNPAMLVWLDGVLNTKQAPNENFGRELMELFTMGPGNYTEKDVQEAARAFTGWTLVTTIVFDFTRYEETFRFDVANHDFGMKRFLGMTGRLNGHQVIDIILSQPAAPRFLARKLLSFFVYPDPEPDLVEETARVIRMNDWEMRPVLRFILNTDAFWSEKSRYALIKSPVEFVVGFMKQVDFPNPTGADLAKWTRLMGQELFNPPSVKGWSGGRHWLNSFTYLNRFDFAQDMLGRRTSLSLDRLITPLAQAGVDGAGAVVDRYLDRMGPLAPAPGEREALASYLETGPDGARTPFRLDQASCDAKLRGLIQLTAGLPAYHMN